MQPAHPARGAGERFSGQRWPRNGFARARRGGYAGGMDDFEIFLVATPGLEAALCAEAIERGFADAQVIEGGVRLRGGWPEVWRANLELRGVTRVLVRIATFR